MECSALGGVLSTGPGSCIFSIADPSQFCGEAGYGNDLVHRRKSFGHPFCVTTARVEHHRTFFSCPMESSNHFVCSAGLPCVDECDCCLSDDDFLDAEACTVSGRSVLFLSFSPPRLTFKCSRFTEKSCVVGARRNSKVRVFSAWLRFNCTNAGSS